MSAAPTAERLAARLAIIAPTIAERVSALRAACSAEMRAVMEQAKARGDLANSADAMYVYELAAMVLSCNRVEEIIQKRETRKDADAG